MNQADQIALLLRKNDFTFNEDGTINYPRGGNYYFQQNLILSLYVNNGVDRDGPKYVIRQPVTILNPKEEIAIAA